jgi:hemolysin III
LGRAVTTAALGAFDEIRPRLRGWLHAATVPIAIPAGVLIAMRAPRHLQLAVAVYSVTTVLVFSVSAVYHRIAWPTRFRSWWQRADHSTIFLFIVGTFTPVAMVSFNATWSWWLLSLMWGSGIVGIAIIWLLGIRAVVGVLYIVLGWAGLLALAPFMAAAGVVAGMLMLAGGLCYTVGAMASRFQRPNPWPSVFGYHEVFHAMTVVAAVCQYAAVAIAVSRPT